MHVSSCWVALLACCHVAVLGSSLLASKRRMPLSQLSVLLNGHVLNNHHVDNTGSLMMAADGRQAKHSKSAFTQQGHHAQASISLPSLCNEL